MLDKEIYLSKIKLLVIKEFGLYFMLKKLIEKKYLYISIIYIKLY